MSGYRTLELDKPFTETGPTVRGASHMDYKGPTHPGCSEKHKTIKSVSSKTQLRKSK